MGARFQVIFLFAMAIAGNAAPDDRSLQPDTRLAALPRNAPHPDGINSSEAVVELGRLLFFDPILSATQQVACATCHHPEHGWADGRATPLGVFAHGLGPQRQMLAGHAFAPLARNTPTLLNVAFNGIETGKPHDPSHAPMMWDNRVTGLEAQVLIPLRSREEMRGDAAPDDNAIAAMVKRVAAIPGYADRFQNALQGNVTAAHVAQAIAAYERTLITPDTPFDRFMRGDTTAMSPLQQRGMEAFQRAGCALCHQGPMLSDYQLHTLGVVDGTSSRQDFRSPTLRQLKDTAPYMHNGSLRTLEDVLLFYDALMDTVSETLDGADQTHPPLDPLLRRLNLQPEDHEPILAFLQALSTDNYDRSIPAKVPSGLPPAGIPASSSAAASAARPAQD